MEANDDSLQGGVLMKCSPELVRIRVGAELVSATIDATMELGKPTKGRAAKCAAPDPTLQEIVAAWDTLPGPIQEAIRLMVKAAKT